MVVDALVKANDSLKIVDEIHEPASFWKVCELYTIGSLFKDSDYTVVDSKNIQCS